MRRHEAVEAAEAQKVCDVAEVVSIVKEELGPWLGATDVAALLRDVPAGEGVHVVVLGLARDAIIAELRRRALDKDVEAPRVERLILSLCAKASDSEVEARRNTAAAVKRGLYGHAAAFAGTQDGPVNASEHFGNGGTGRATLIAWPRHDASKAMNVPADAPQAPHLKYVHAWERGDLREICTTGIRVGTGALAERGATRRDNDTRLQAAEEGLQQAAGSLYLDVVFAYAQKSMTKSSEHVLEPSVADAARCYPLFFKTCAQHGLFHDFHTIKAKGAAQAEEVRKHIIDMAEVAIDVSDVIHAFHRLIARLAGDDVPDAEGKKFFLVFSDSGDLLVELWYHPCATGARAMQQRHSEAQTDAILWGGSDSVVGIGASPLMWSFGGGDANAYYEALRVALAPLRLEPTFVFAKGVPRILAAAVLARLAAVDALPEGASEEQQREALDAVAGALKDIICLDERRFVGGDAENEPLPVAQQLRLDREFEERVEQKRRRSPEQRAPRRRPNQSRATNPSSHVLHVPSQEASTNKRLKTVETYNAHRPSGMAASGDYWASDEMKKLLKAIEAIGRVPPRSGWQPVAAAVGSRSAEQCRAHYIDLKKLGRLDPISEDTPLRAGIFPGFGKPAFNKFDKCVAKIDGKRITTVGQLAKLPVDNIGPNLSYLKELTGLKDNAAFKKALAWKAMAVEAIEFWQ